MPVRTPTRNPMRWYVLRALLAKEARRHLANRGGIALALLLVAAAVLLAVFAPGEAAGGTGMVGGVHHCLVDYEAETPLVRHLKASVPRPMASQVVFRKRDPDRIGGLDYAETGTGAIQLRELADPPTLTVYVMHPDGEPTAMAAYEAWFWREARRHLAAAARARHQPSAAASASAALAFADGVVLPDPPFDAQTDWAVQEAHRRFQGQAAGVPDLEVRRKGLGGKVLGLQAAIATGMVVFALYFACVYLLPTLNCEERERGVLLAQALSPASPTEILAAKFLFYPVAGMALAAVIAGVYKPAVLGSLFFWLALLAVAGGFLGIGMTVATLAKTQRAAFLGAMCYLLSVSMVLLICSTNGIPLLPNLALEYHGPRILHAALAGSVESRHWVNLAAALGLAAAWLGAAGWLFRRRGWQ